MDIVDISELDIDKEFYIMSKESHSLEIDKCHLKSFYNVRYIGKKTTDKKLRNIEVDPAFYRYFFKGTYDTIVKRVLKAHEIDQMLFHTIDDVLVYLVMRLDRLNKGRLEEDRALYRFDDYVKEQVKLSQEQFPEKWI